MSADYILFKNGVIQNGPDVGINNYGNSETSISALNTIFSDSSLAVISLVILAALYGAAYVTGNDALALFIFGLLIGGLVVYAWQSV